MRIVTGLDVRMYRCTGRKNTNHGVVCVIIGYGERRLKVDWLNRDDIKKKKNITSEINDRSFESNSCTRKAKK